MKPPERFVKYWTLEQTVDMSTVQMNMYQSKSCFNVCDILNIPLFNRFLQRISICLSAYLKEVSPRIWKWLFQGIGEYFLHALLTKLCSLYPYILI